jgi:hypothetical protein
MVVTDSEYNKNVFKQENILVFDQRFRSVSMCFSTKHWHLACSGCPGITLLVPKTVRDATEQLLNKHGAFLGGFITAKENTEL